jgi:hypothetical protein
MFGAGVRFVASASLSCLLYLENAIRDIYHDPVVVVVVVASLSSSS